ncbi:MAG TPA: MFS transporter [Terriglobales bacterium]|nr:MFS transporter [Terriglobales bacterium]
MILPPEVTSVHAARATRVRWKVLAWLCSFSAITYVGRVAIIQVQDRIEFDLHITPTRLAYAFSSFALAYALFEVPSGWLGDRLGPRKVLIRIILFWIVFTALTGVAWSLMALVVVRFFFGAGEAGAFPNIGRASREWFPFSERGLTQGLVWLFARWGGALAPLLIMLFSLPFSWRGGFVLMSLLGAVWLWGFATFYRDSPQEDPRVNAAERSLITEGRKAVGTSLPLSWSTMLRSPTLWSLSLMYFCSNAGWSFFISWVTPFLERDLHLSGMGLVFASGGPLFCGGIACLLGGFLTDRQVRLWGRRWGRTLQGVIAYGLGGAFMLAAVACTPRHIMLAYASLCLSSFVKDFGMAASWSTTIDIGHRYSGTVGGFMNTVGNLSQVISVPVVAWLAALAGTPGRPDWGVSLYFYAAMFFVASVCWLFVDPRRVIVYASNDIDPGL